LEWNFLTTGKHHLEAKEGAKPNKGQQETKKGEKKKVRTVHLESVCDLPEYTN